MKVLLVGNGGREVALARNLVRTATSSDPVELIVQAGNPGLEPLGQSLVFNPLNTDDVAVRAKALGVDLVVVGPEAPLVAGVADAVRAEGIPVFGPSKAAAQLEASKAFAKEIMEAAGVPTARAFTCRTTEEVETAFNEFGAPYVVKDDALAAGKGVVVTDDRNVALAHATTCLNREDGVVLVEEYLDGPEVSLFCVSDGTTVVPLVPAQDFKRVGDGNSGPNTGGMGAYTPLPWLDDSVVDEVVKTVAQPTIDEMARRGTPFVGLLYCGLAMTSKGIRVVEFNVRFGDPETQVVLERLDSSLADLLYAAARGTLAHLPAPIWSPDAVVTVVMASGGYPDTPDTGHEITGIEDAEAVDGVHVIHAGTRFEITSSMDEVALGCCGFEPDEMLVNSGGRVLDVVGRGATVAEARAKAYEGVDWISFAGEHHRKDIATWPAELDAKN
ncbi:phosphoribosylamine--glycine ligase [Pauljensenia sp. OF14-1SRA]|uniref:phosphoribosylamine--glycine ligase n=1 Tax=Pauljensenia sp. OF14-1SRA TaxID=2998062 RepID=UPI0022E6E15E|nr:phosphoribosylamine--glycine ligase [Pauljensenia sp. OF14-1SRA]